MYDSGILKKTDFKGIKIDAKKLEEAIELPNRKGVYDTNVFISDYVVIEAKSEGGGHGMGDHDVYPDGWRVTARQLNKNGSYNPRGKKVTFYQSGCFSAMNKDVKVIRKMEKKEQYV